LGIDIGGTCTDFALLRATYLHELKVPTTPGDLVQGVLQGLAQLAQRVHLDTRQLLGEVESIVHGTTVATNALLTNTTARTALFTTAGHRDILMLREAGRMGLSAFDHSLRNPKPFIPRALTYEVPERIDASGRVVTPLDEKIVSTILDSLEDEPPASVAVCLLWSITNPGHELRLAEMIHGRFPDIHLSLSHLVNPCIREYRRASATSIDAALKPLVDSYAANLLERLRRHGFEGGLWFATSEGTVSPVDDTSPIHLVRSGPALGPVAAIHYLDAVESAQAISCDAVISPTTNAILIDVGGTTLDVSLIRNGAAGRTRETWLGTPYLGHMTGFPAIDVRSIGAGGGSIARVVSGKLIKVGPDSAGAQPGPASYLNGGVRASVTDAAVVLGYVDAATFIDEPAKAINAAARRAIETDIAEPLGLSCEQAADAVFRIFVEDAAASIEDMTVAQGTDPRQMTLIATGGAGGLLACALARRLGLSRVMFPPTASVNCAAGGVLAAIKRNFVITRPISSQNFDTSAVAEIVAKLTARCTQFGEQFPSSAGEVQIEFFVEARYQNQSWEIEVPIDAAAADAQRLTQLFHAAHRRVYHYEDPTSSVDFLTWRASATLHSTATVSGRERTGLPSKRSERPVRFAAAEPALVPVVNDVHLYEQREMCGPLIVECALTTIVADSGTRVSVNSAGCIVLDLD